MKTMLKIIFMGTPEFSVPILEALDNTYDVIAVVTQPDKEVGRHRILTPSPVKEYAVKHNIQVFQPVHIKEEYDALINLGADLIVTAAYGQFVGTKLLYAPKYKAINCHGSLLPKYRGGAPIQEAIKQGEEYTGITIMYMEKKMDAGDILSKREVKIEDTDDNLSLFNKMSLTARDLLMETIPLLIEGKITPIKQEEDKATFAYNITKEDTLLDFTKPARNVYNHIRAYHPSPLTYFMINGNVIKVYQASPNFIKTDKNAGELILDYKNRLFVACGDGQGIELLIVQAPGKKEMSARDFINGSLRTYLK